MAQKPKAGIEGGKAFHHVTARVFCHATEVEERVVDALAFIVAADRRSEEKRRAFEKQLERVASEGHHGNPIVIFEAHVKRSADIDRFWDAMMADAAVRRVFTTEFGPRLDDELVLHARFDKQLASQGKLRFATSDDCVAIRAKVAAFPKKRDIALQALDAFFR